MPFRIDDTAILCEVLRFCKMKLWRVNLCLVL